MSNEAHHHLAGRRVEDARLITGAGRYAADWNPQGQLHAAFVRRGRPQKVHAIPGTGADCPPVAA